MVLTWAEAEPGLVLEYNPDLMTSDWIPMTNTTSYTGQRVFTNTVSSAQAFYRLRAF